MNITLNHTDFQCLQDQLVDLKTKNYELAEKNRRGQADFEAAKAKVCSLQLKLEEQERDFQITTSTLRKEIEEVQSVKQDAANSSNEKSQHYKAKYKILKQKAKDILQLHEKSSGENAILQREVEHKDKTLIELKSAIEELKLKSDQLDTIKQERDNFEQQVRQISAKLNQQVEEKKIQDKKGAQMVKELKRQLALEKSKNETIQKRLETLLSSNESHGSWNLVPENVGDSNLSICSIDISDERDTTKHTSTSVATTGDTKSDSDKVSTNSQHVDQQILDANKDCQSAVVKPVVPLDEQASPERIAQLQHDKWVLEEKSSLLEQANIALTEELANKSEIIKNYFINQALKTKQKEAEDLPPFLIATAGTRKISFSNNLNQLLNDHSGLKKVFEFVKERSQQIASPESETVTREATKKMQLMLEETLIKCLKLQENLDFVTNELNNKLRD